MNMDRVPGETQEHLTSPAAAVARAQRILKIEQNLDHLSGSFFDVIVANEVAVATSLASRMLGDYRMATETVHVAFERARADFSSFDGVESPRSWVLGYVAGEALRRSGGNEDGGSGRPRSAEIADTGQPDAEAVLHTLGPERRLAIILTDVLGMTDEVAARISGVDLGTVRSRASAARSWIIQALRPGARRGRTVADGALG